MTLPRAYARLHALHVPPFVARRALASPHAQTMLVPYLAAPTLSEGERITVPIDGGSLTGRLHRAGSPARSAMLVLHGIAGTADEPFVRRTASDAVSQGIDALRLDLRGSGESSSPGPAPLYHAGLTADVRAALTWLAERYDHVHAVGFSLGGQLVLRTLGEWGADTPNALASATAISPPIDLDACARHADAPGAWLYRAFILRALRARFARARPAMGSRFRGDVLRGVRTFRGYDAAVVAPFFGFRDVDDYYASCSAAPLMGRIVVPTLVLHAIDDPIVPSAPVEALDVTALPAVRTIVTARGGHVGFVRGSVANGDRHRHWAEHRAVDLATAYSR